MVHTLAKPTVVYDIAILVWHIRGVPFRRKYARVDYRGRLLRYHSTCTLQIRKSVHTTHRSNIFSAKFLPSCCDLRTVSCAGIGSVEYSEFTPDGEYIGHPFRCQNSITYQVSWERLSTGLAYCRSGNFHVVNFRMTNFCVENCHRNNPVPH